MIRTPDVLVVGGGVIGLATARAFARRHPGSQVVVIDKEDHWGAHASGRNSGVLHAGFYYSADSLKARFSLEGNQRWRRFCRDRRIPLNECGKLVVARSTADHAGLDDLLRRAAVNGVRLVPVDAEQARRIEPRVRTVERALWSPDTATVDPRAAMQALASSCTEAGVVLHRSTTWLSRHGRAVETSAGRFEPGLVVNCAGLYADRVAAAWGAGSRWRLLPFKGLYVDGDHRAPPLACCVYPVPDLGMPFLGVHLTVTPDGGTRIGPTAFPARWRQDYGGLADMKADEVIEQVRAQSRLMWTNPGFRALGVRELPKLSRRVLVQRASALVRGLSSRSFRRWGRPGVRAQLFDRRSGRLHMDFVVEEAERSLHVLNAVSPAFTCAMPFADWLVDRLEGDA